MKFEHKKKMTNTLSLFKTIGVRSTKVELSSPLKESRASSEISRAAKNQN